MLTNLFTSCLTATKPLSVIVGCVCRAVNGSDFLLTWNCTHIANAARRSDIEALVEDAGYSCPIICTPEELMES